MRCLLVICALLLAACGSAPTSEAPRMMAIYSAAAGAPVVCLGDSITFLLGDPPLGEGSVNRGISGATTLDTLRELPLVTAQKPETVFLLIGTNDIRNGLRAGLEERIVAIALALAPAKVYAVSILPTKGGDNTAIMQVNSYLKSVFKEQYVDAWSVFNPSLLSADGLHPNAAGLAELRKLYLATIR